ncbi:MAG: cytochrome c oxidase subunit II [Oligoflexales bacterium]
MSFRSKFRLCLIPFFLVLTSCILDKNDPMTSIYPLTEWGRDINYLYLITTVICTAIAIIVAGVLVYVLYRFREKPGDTHMPKQIKGNHKLELVWSIIPVVLLIFIFVPTAETIFKYSETPQDALEIEVIGHQWWWEFKYPEYNIVTANELHLPENRAVHITMTSADVIHSFWIPRFGGKVDTLPGETTHMTFTTPAGEKVGGDYYQGQCFELCGLSHALMRFQAVVHKTDEFKRWTDAYNADVLVASDLEKKGQQLMTDKICVTCHTISGTTAAGLVGPNLTNFGSRRTLAAGTLPNTREQLKKWLKDPPAVKPGSLMPNLQLADDEIEAIASYLLHSTAKKY